MKRITMLGAGSWASAVANTIAAEAKVTMYARRQDQADEINNKHTNSRYLGQESLHPSIRATNDLEEALEAADLVINGVPTQASRSVFLEAKAFIPKDVPLVNLSKGLNKGPVFACPKSLRKFFPTILMLSFPVPLTRKKSSSVNRPRSSSLQKIRGLPIGFSSSS